MRDSWLDKYHQHHREEDSTDAFDAFIELSETFDVNFDEDKAWAKVKSSIGREDHAILETSNPSRFSILYKIAAAIALIIISFVVYEVSFESDPQQITISTENKPLDHKLPDGSVVYLDVNSSLSYAEDLKHRIVEFKGTGYYDVVKAGSTFTVNSGGFKIEVLGTVFTIETSSSELSTYVKEGRVQVSRHAEVHQVNPGEVLTYKKNQEEFSLSKNTNPNILSWKTGKFVFKNTPLLEVFENLERYYKVDFQNTKSFADCTITAEFDQQKLADVLSIIDEILDIEFIISGTKIKTLGKGCH